MLRRRRGDHTERSTATDTVTRILLRLMRNPLGTVSILLVGIVPYREIKCIRDAGFSDQPFPAAIGSAGITAAGAFRLLSSNE